MRLPLHELLEQLGVGYVLGGYQTHPWSHMNYETGQTCSAEVRMGPDEDELEIELQMMYDTPPEGTPPLQQLMNMVAKRQADGKWEIKILRIKGENKVDAFSGWAGKACELFRACTRKLMAEDMPDDIFRDGRRTGGSTGQGGGKQPKIKPGQLLDVKKGMGF